MKITGMKRVNYVQTSVLWKLLIDIRIIVFEGERGKGGHGAFVPPDKPKKKNAVTLYTLIHSFIIESFRESPANLQVKLNK